MSDQYLVPVDDNFGEILNWAVRYALGRKTYAVMDTCNYIKPLIPCLSNRTLWCMERDINNQEDLGDICDEEYWIALHESIQQELQKRTSYITEQIG